MPLCRFVSIVGLTMFTAGTIVAAAPAKKPAALAKRKRTPEKAPAPTPPPPPVSEPGAASPSSQPAGDPSVANNSPTPAPEPPPDMQGTSEMPEDPKVIGTEVAPVVVTKPIRPPGYPIEEALRPITLPAYMTEISIAPHLQVSPVTGSDAIRARFGITSKVQVGLTYLYVGLYNRQSVDPGLSSKYALHGGKAFGIDVTVQLQDWLAVKVGVPLYTNPFAASLALGLPIKFAFAEKFAIGGLDDLLDIKLHRFAPSLYQEVVNAQGALVESSQTQQSRGHLRFSAYGIYQHSPQLAVIGRLGIDNDLGLTSDGPAGTRSGGGTVTFTRLGLQYAVRRAFDAGISLGWDSLATLGSFGPQLYFALRI